MSKKTIGVIVGSARKESYNKKVAQLVCGFLQPEFEIKNFEIAGLPLFNQDYDDEGHTPKEWQAFREDVAAADAYLFVTPEYNRSFPALIKNALDIASRPYGQNRWNGKPCGVISVSTGAIGGFGANNHLRQVLNFLNMHAMSQPEVYVGKFLDLLDANGEVGQGTKAFLKSYAEAFSQWVNKF